MNTNFPEKNDIMESVSFFQRLKDEKKSKDRLKFERIDAEVFFDDIFSIAKDKSDIKWIAECLCSAIDLAMTDRAQDLIHECPKMGEYGGDLFEFESEIEIYVD